VKQVSPIPAHRGDHHTIYPLLKENFDVVLLFLGLLVSVAQNHVEAILDDLVLDPSGYPVSPCYHGVFLLAEGRT
jgi:hypothetical protein